MLYFVCIVKGSKNAILWGDENMVLTSISQSSTLKRREEKRREEKRREE